MTNWIPNAEFNDFKLDVTAEHEKFVAQQRKVSELATRGELAQRRTRTRRGRRQIQAEISAALFGTADPFRPSFQPLKRWMNGRIDLQGLPLAMGYDCRIDSSQAEDLQSVSATFQMFRRNLSRMPGGEAKEAALLKVVKDQRWNYRHIPGLIQVLSAEKEPLRLQLVRILTTIRSPRSTSALARIAVFDLSAGVREQAVAALQKRRPENYRDQLLSGLRYVWPPAADNAARALVSLDDRDAYDQLVEMVREPDPLAPFQTADTHWATKELVRVNHMQNCLLCHAPAVASNARVTGAVPSPYDPLPRVYYDSPGGFLARADVTYLRQDFSVMHDVEEHGPWPERQRFDYFVRERSLTEQEAAELSQRASSEVYPQRAAVLFAMRMLRTNESGDSRPSSNAPLLLSAD